MTVAGRNRGGEELGRRLSAEQDAEIVDTLGPRNFSRRGLTTTYTFDRNGNKTIVRESVNIYSMGYDNMNRLNYQIDGSNRFTYTYDASSLKRYEDAPTGRTMIVWDGANYLQGRI